MLRAVFTILICACLNLAACAWNIGEDQLDLVETGVPIDAQKQQFLPWLLRDVHLLVGPDGAPWLAAPGNSSELDDLDTDDPQGGVLGSISVFRLVPPFAGYALPPVVQRISFFPPVPSHSICSYRQGGTESWLVSFRRIDQAVAPEFPTGPQPPLLICGQRTMAYWQPSSDNSYIYILRLADDGTVVQQRLQWPVGARPDIQQGPVGFDENEKVLFVTDGDYRTLAYYLDSPAKVDLGVLYWGQTRGSRYVAIDLDGFINSFDIPTMRNQTAGFRLGPYGQLLGVDEDRREVLTCDWDGLRAVSLPQPALPSTVVANQRVLDPQPCLAGSSQLPALGTGSVVLYSPASDPSGQEVRAATMGSPTPPKILVRPGGQRLLGVCGDSTVAYSLDPADRYGPSVSDGWIGSQRYMERGRETRFSPTCDRVYFKEHAANVRKLGDLRSAPVPSPDGGDASPLPRPRRLGRNAGFYRVAPDGKLLAMVDLSVVGVENRLLLIDDARGEAQALAHSINAVTGVLFIGSFLPDRREILLEVRDSDPGRQAGLLLVTLPAPRPSM